jgi:hypothetical protein
VTQLQLEGPCWRPPVALVCVQHQPLLHAPPSSWLRWQLLFSYFPSQTAELWRAGITLADSLLPATVPEMPPSPPLLLGKGIFWQSNATQRKSFVNFR